MERIYDNIRIIPLKDTLIHEGTVAPWVKRIAHFMQHDGIVKNPVIATRKDDKFIVLDGMHRVGAMKHLHCSDILAYLVDIDRSDVILSSWDGLVLGEHDIIGLMESRFASGPLKPREVTGDVYQFIQRVKERKYPLGYISRNGRMIALEPVEGQNDIEHLVSAVETVESALDEREIRMIYSPANRSFEELHDTPSTGLFIRPQFTKDEVVARTLERKIFPRKSTRFLIPERPLRVDISFILLKEEMDLEIKNQFLSAHLQWCWENGRVRYYPEGVYIFND